MSDRKRFITVGGLMTLATVFYAVAIPHKSLNIYAVGYGLLMSSVGASFGIAAYSTKSGSKMLIAQNVSLGDVTQTIGQITQTYDFRGDDE